MPGSSSSINHVLWCSIHLCSIWLQCHPESQGSYSTWRMRTAYLCTLWWCNYYVVASNGVKYTWTAWHSIFSISESIPGHQTYIQASDLILQILRWPLYMKLLECSFMTLTGNHNPVSPQQTTIICWKFQSLGWKHSQVRLNLFRPPILYVLKNLG